MKLESCFNCLDLEEVFDKDYNYFCPIHQKEIFNPKEAGCDVCRTTDKLRGIRRKQKYIDERVGMWY